MAHSTGRWLADLYKAGRHTYYISQIFHLIIKFCVEKNKKVLVIVCAVEIDQNQHPRHVMNDNNTIIELWVHIAVCLLPNLLPVCGLSRPDINVTPEYIYKRQQREKCEGKS